MEEKKVSIKITPETHSMLGDVGKKKETYDEIIRRLIEFYEKNKDLVEG